mgnify:CR=1 FL=1|jgi:hypothetical protein
MSFSCGALVLTSTYVPFLLSLLDLHGQQYPHDLHPVKQLTIKTPCTN